MKTSEAPGTKDNPIEIDHPDQARANRTYIIRPKPKAVPVNKEAASGEAV
jgi:hypothetical protein